MIGNDQSKIIFQKKKKSKFILYFFVVKNDIFLVFNIFQEEQLFKIVSYYYQ